MNKLFQKMLVMTASATLLSNLGMSVFAEQSSQPMLSLGGSLQQTQEVQTRSLLGAENVSAENTVYVDGITVNAYLGDGSNGGTAVYSSALIEPKPAGFGVQVQIVTPNNITLVTPITYQNAAITSGAKDVSIKIATVSPVTGEGALAGVYALLEKNGKKLDKRAIKVAEKEIEIVEKVKEEDELSDIQANQLMSDIKKEIILRVTNGKEIDTAEAKVIIHEMLDKNQISPNLVSLTNLVEFSLEFSKTEAAKNKETVTQLEESVDRSIWNVTKRLELQSYMSEWSKEMGQSYTEYSMENSGNYYGLKIPNDILNKIAIHQIPVQVEWAADEVKPNLYNLVSVYKEDKNEEGAHLYLFMLYNGEAVVYHTQQSSGDESGLFHFTPTENERLGNGFSEIIKGITASALLESEALMTAESNTSSTVGITNSEIWNAEKHLKLQAFVTEWSAAMGQSYLEYSPETPGDFYGASMPMYAIEHFGLAGQLYPATWSPMGDTPGVYNVVACYIEETLDFPGMYLFAIYNGEPIVLYSKQNQGGQSHNGFYLKPTENIELSEGFRQIVNE